MEALSRNARRWPAYRRAERRGVYIHPLHDGLPLSKKRGRLAKETHPCGTAGPRPRVKHWEGGKAVAVYDAKVHGDVKINTSLTPP